MNLSNISIIYLNNIQNETERSKLGTVNQKKNTSPFYRQSFIRSHF